MRLKKTFIIFMIAMILLNFSLIFATNENNNKIKNYFRIHVVANSDSIEDQLLKYTIAKEVNAYILRLTINSNSKEESKQIIESNIQNILTLCNNVITNENYTYSVKAYVGTLEYSSKESDNIYMSAGVYDSIKIVIGKGNGHNWWSLIYPTSLQEYSNTNSYDSNYIKYDLFIVKWFKNLLS